MLIELWTAEINESILMELPAIKALSLFSFIPSLAVLLHRGLGNSVSTLLNYKYHEGVQEMLLGGLTIMRSVWPRHQEK